MSSSFKEIETEPRSLFKRYVTTIMSGKALGKSTAFRPDSPRTKEAIRLLGLKPNFHEIKDISHFGGPDISEEICKIRLDRHTAKVKKLITEVIETRKDIIRRKKFMSEPNEEYDLNKSKSRIKSIHTLNKSVNTSKILNSSAYLKTLDNNNPFLETYNKTISYLRGSHGSPHVESSKILLQTEDPDVSMFNEKLEEELDKFNKLKSQKQKEAQTIYKEEIKRMKTLQDIKEKEERIVKMHSKLKQEKKQQKEKAKEMAKEKLEKLRGLERKFIDKKRQENESMRKKLEELKERQMQLIEEKESQRKEMESKMQIKQSKIETMKQDKEKRELEFCLQQMERLEQKMNVSKELHESLLHEKVRKIKGKLDQEIELSSKHKDDESQARLNKLVEKMVNKTKALKVYENNRKQEELKRKQMIEEKEMGIQSSQARLNNQKKQRIDEILKKEKKIEDALKLKKKLEEDAISKKQQLRKIQQEDKLENYDIQKRRKEYQLVKMLGKDRKNEEKLNLMKSQQEILKLARIEVSVQSRVERNRINQGIEQVKKVLNSQKPNKNDLVGSISDREKSKTMKILRTMFKEDQIDTSIFQVKPKDKKNQSVTNIPTPVEPEKKPS